MPVPPGTMDKFNYILALMRDLSRGERGVEYTIADGGRLRRYVLTSIGEERIETALGTFDTIVIRRERENSKRRRPCGVRARWAFSRVKLAHVEPNGKPVTSIFVSLSGIERREP